MVCQSVRAAHVAKAYDQNLCHLKPPTGMW
jgi:hypothetical protein